MSSIKVKHNVEMAHRLFLTPGKCEAIHGHSWNITLELFGTVDSHGLLGSLDFADVKYQFRNYLDNTFDHRVLLNTDDPWTKGVLFEDGGVPQYLPGLQTSQGDPTTEWLAEHIGHWAGKHFERQCAIEVWETRVNCATWSNVAASA